MENKALLHFGAYLHDDDDASFIHFLLHGRENWKNFLKNVYENGDFHGWNGWTYHDTLQVFVIFPPIVLWLHLFVQGSVLPPSILQE